MNRWLCLIFLTTLAITGCSNAVRPDKPPPIPAQCDAKCFVPCDTAGPKGSAPMRWHARADDAGAWDRLITEVLSPLVERLDRCEVSRKACEQCLQRLEEAEVISR